MGRKIGIVMEVAEKSDGEAAQTFRPAQQKQILAHNAGAVRLQQDGICGKRKRAGSASGAKKVASCDRQSGQKDLLAGSNYPGPHPAYRESEEY
jgi:hypothetical protein